VSASEVSASHDPDSSRDGGDLELSLNTSARSALYRRVDPIEQALEQLYRSRYRRFEGVLTTLTGDREAARDVVQEAFAIALARRRQFRGEGSLEGWVWKIALRLTAGLRPGSSKSLPDQLDPALPEAESDPALAAAIRGLSPRRRLVVFLRYFADLSYDEIAVACGISRGTVSATLAQAHAELEAALESKNATEGVAR
jgi:RNA polymerase sigma-70 factor (ECF subfamily)